MGPRAKNRLVKVVVLLLAAAGLWLAVRSAPPRDDAPAVLAVLRQVQGGDTQMALQGTALQDTWDLPGLMAHGIVLKAQLGEVQQVLASEPAEPVPGSGGTLERRRLRLAFAKRTVEGTFTFARRGGRWYVQSWDLPLVTPPGVLARPETAERAATELLDALAKGRWDTLQERRLRTVRLAERPEAYRTRLTARVQGLGAVREVLDRAFVAEPGVGGVLTARLVYEAGERRVRLRVVFAVDEGRFLVDDLQVED